MPLCYNIGQINDPRTRLHVEWKIYNYFSVPQYADSVFMSPPIHFLDAQWNILLYPNGSRQKQTVGMVDIYLEVRNPIANYSVTFILGIKDVLTLGPMSAIFNQTNFLAGWSHFTERLNLGRHMHEHSSIQDPLTVCCDVIADVSSVIDKACQTTFLNSTSQLCRDFQELLRNEEKSDFTIYVRERVFKVHKLIMESRCSVFAAMFGHDMRENSEGDVRIDDCDPGAFEDFLKHMYTGQVENISWGNVIHLFSIADKYGVIDLKSQCVEFMVDAMSAEYACDVLLVADRHNETQLKNSAETFLIQNIAQIKTTDKWETFMSENPTVALDIFMKCS